MFGALAFLYFAFQLLVYRRQLSGPLPYSQLELVMRFLELLFDLVPVKRHLDGGV